MILNYFPVAVIFVSVLCSGRQINGQGTEEWRDLHDKIYTNDAKGALTPLQTHQYLLQLRDIYTGSQDSGSRKRLSIVSNLLLVSEISKDRCLDAQQMGKVLDAANYDSAHVVNIVPYVESYLKSQISICRDKIEAQFALAKDRMGPTMFAKLQTLAAHITDKYLEDKQHDRYDLTAIVEASRRDQDPDWYLRDENDRQWFFETNVEPVCREAEDKLANIAYVGLLGNNSITSGLSKEVAQVLINLPIMRQIVAQKHDIIRKMRV